MRFETVGRLEDPERGRQLRGRGGVLRPGPAALVPGQPPQLAVVQDDISPSGWAARRLPSHPGRSPVPPGRPRLRSHGSTRPFWSWRTVLWMSAANRRVGPGIGRAGPTIFRPAESHDWRVPALTSNPVNRVLP